MEKEFNYTGTCIPDMHYMVDITFCSVILAGMYDIKSLKLKIHDGITQLADYLQKQNADKGYPVIFDFNKSMAYKQENINIQDRNIFMVWV